MAIILLLISIPAFLLAIYDIISDYERKSVFINLIRRERMIFNYLPVNEENLNLLAREKSLNHSFSTVKLTEKDLSVKNRRFVDEKNRKKREEISFEKIENRFEKKKKKYCAVKKQNNL